MTAIIRFEKTAVFALGAVCYGLCELLWRGYTHPTMLFLGGVCFVRLYLVEKRYHSLSLPLRCFAGGVFITALELVTGCVVNRAFGMNVWDYSDLPFNFYGQICPHFFVAWMLLCIPAFALSEKLNAFFQKTYL